MVLPTKVHKCSWLFRFANKLQIIPSPYHRPPPPSFRRIPFINIHPSSALFPFPSDRRRRRHFIIPCANSHRFRLGWLLFAGSTLPSPAAQKVHAFVYPTHFPPPFCPFPPRVKGDSAGKKNMLPIIIKKLPSSRSHLETLF